MNSRSMLVDDDALVQRSLKYRLERKGYAVTTCKAAQLNG
jgi:ActR/RegA family two-component response regulator